MRRALLALPALLLVASSAAAGATRIELFRDRLFLDARVNGVRAVALLDSAAEMSVIDRAFAARLGLRLGSNQAVNGSGGTDTGQFAHGLSLAAAGVRLPARVALVLDLGDLSERLLGRPVAMILGREMFDAARLRIDIARGALSAVPRARRPRGARFQLTTVGGVETFPVRIDGAPAQAEFDLGNGSEVLIGRAFAERNGLLAPDRLVGSSEGGGIGGRVRRDVVVLKTLALGDRTFENVRAAIDATPHGADVNVGTAILKHFLITTDFAQRALWLEPRDPLP